MDDRLVIAFCQACQSLFAPWREACPVCSGAMVAVWVTDALPGLIAAIEAETEDGSILEVCLDDDAAHAALIAELVGRSAAHAV